MMKRLLKPFLFPFGRHQTQWFFEQLRRFALIGLNVSRGGRVEESGEAFVLRTVKKRLGSSPACIFDVGANVGDWSLAVAKIFQSNPVQVYAFEPSQYTFEKLKERLNHHSNFHLFNLGLGNQNTQMSLFSNQPASGIASLYQRKLDHFGVTLHSNETVKIRTLDSFCQENQISKIDFLKLDVEGHELHVLEGAKQLLESKAIHFIQFEFGGCNIDSRTYFQDFHYLLNSKYNIFRVLKNGLYPIPNYREIDECFMTTNYLAELR